MSTMGNLVIRLEANIAKFESDLGRAAHVAEQSMKRIEKNSGHAMESLKRLDERFLGLGNTIKMFATAAIGGGMVEIVKGSLDAADQMGKMAQKAGVSIESLSRMSVAARLSDVDTQSLAKGMGHLSQSITQAASGIGMQAQAFDALGIKVKDAHGNLKNADTIMVEMADKFAKLQDGSGKTAAAMAIMGKEGANMIPMLNQGSEEMNKFADMSDRLGLTLDNKTSQAAQDVNDRFTIMGMSMQGIGLQVMRNMLPAFDNISTAMMDAATNTDTMKTIADELSAGLKLLVSTGMAVNFVFQSMGGAIGAAAAAAMAAMHGDFSAASSIMDQAQQDQKQRVQDMSGSMDKLWETEGEKTARKQKEYLEKVLVVQKYYAGYSASIQQAAMKSLAHAFFPSQVQASTNSTKHKLNWDQGGTQLTTLQDTAAGSGVMQGMTGNFDQQIRARQEQMKIMSASAMQLAQEYDKIANSESKARQQADKLYAGGKMTASTYHDVLKKITAEAERQRDATHALQVEQDQLNSSWEYGAKKALQTYLDAAQNTAAQSNKLFTNMFKGMEDALVSFVQTGKLDFKSLANSMIADLIRIQVQKGIASMFGGKTGALSSLFGSANGNAFTGNGTQKFANGGSFTNGMFDSPTPFRFASGGGFNLGVMGEAGPEAVMPLTRGANGKLGVQSSGNTKSTQITFAPVYHIDSRADRAQVQQDMVKIARQSNAELVDKLSRQGRI